jgi:hypothetical protein
MPLWERPEIQEVLSALMIEADPKRPNSGVRRARPSRRGLCACCEPKPPRTM